LPFASARAPARTIAFVTPPNAMYRQLYLPAYDISADRRRTGALKLLRAYATGGQKSVHEVWLTAGERRAVLSDFVHILDDGDRFMLLRLDPRSRTLLAGRAQAPADPGHFYIG